MRPSVFAIADLHLSFGVSNKSMEVFGKEWAGWTDKISSRWRQLVADNDLVLIAGDISWAANLNDAAEDLKWLDSLPGQKVLIRGNHDYWWESKSKVKKILPPSVHIVQNDAFHYPPFSVAGSRLWDTSEYHFQEYIIFQGSKPEHPVIDNGQDEKTFLRELHRLELSLQMLDPHAETRIVMTHYPPIGADLASSRVSQLLEKYNVDICVFGHLHSLRPRSLPFGEKNNIRYFLTSCDYMDFTPLRVC